MKIEKDYQILLIRKLFHKPELIGDTIKKVKSFMLTGKMINLYQIITDLFIEGKDINVITIKEKILQDSTLSPDINKILSSLQEKPIGSLEEHIDKIREMYKKRMVVGTCEEIITETKKNPSYNADSKIMDLIEYSQSEEDNIEEEMSSLLSQDIIEFPNDILFRMLHGLVRGEILSIGGEPGHGKTTFALWLIYLFLGLQKIMYVSVELKRKQVLQKLISLISEINSYKIIKKTDDLTQDEKKKIESNIKDLDEKFIKTRQLLIYDKLTNINEVAIEMIKEKPDIVIIDWIQMMDMPDSSNGNMAQGIPALFKIFKKTLKKTNACGVAVGQLEIRKRPDKRPNINDFSDSTAFKKFSSDILLLFRPYQAYNLKKLYNIYELIYDKSRFGVTGKSLMKIVPEYGLFNNQLTPEMIKYYKGIRLAESLP